MHGFKSFVRKTEILFDQGINVILGPNGSGKSNVSDALCFVLGRLSVKSMRAAKAKNLIFLGSKEASPSKEAMVEVVFDNSDGVFALDQQEISIKRIVRRNGLSIYKINNETKTRQDVLMLLSQAGIDPNGFNIILQGEIQNFVRMRPDERRGVIEEVSGIAVYEARKEKSLKELEKTEERLKEISSILRERTAYLNNLEKERQQALKFKKLEAELRSLKASIIKHDMNIREKEIEKIKEELEKRSLGIEKMKKYCSEIQFSIQKFEEEIKQMNSIIEKSTGYEQEKLNREIADIRAEIAGLEVKTENFENKLLETNKQKSDLEKSIKDSEMSLKDLGHEAPMAKKQRYLEQKKKEFEEIEDKRKKFYMIQSELKSIRERIKEKEDSLNSNKTESELLLNQIDSISLELFDKHTNKELVEKLEKSMLDKRQTLEKLYSREREIDKLIYANDYEIKKLNNIINDVSKLDICPLCKSKITSEHINSIAEEIKPKNHYLKENIEKHNKEIIEITNKKEFLNDELERLSAELLKRKNDLGKLNSINEKNNQIKLIQIRIEKIKEEISILEKRKISLEKSYNENSDIEKKYELLKIELQEISLRSQETISSEISFKQREIERANASFKQLIRDEQLFKDDLNTLKKELSEKQKLLTFKNNQEEELMKKFQNLISKRDSTQKSIREKETELLKKQNEIHLFEQEINNIKIDKARIDAEYENLEIEMLSFVNVEIVKASKESLNQRLARTQEILSSIGSVNLRSLEVYEEIKKEYDSIKEKAEIIEKEKNEITKVISEIDIKKKKTFNQTLSLLNDIFSRNFSELSVKGQVFLEVENKQDPFSGGVNIIVKTGHGKYFDVTSLSGGEQTLVALSLIFGIQELKPYCFYILDEIDAALDKRNSERLASLLKKYMQKGQYIVITHNDEIISNATTLYGVSMHDGLSKIISLKL